MASVAPVKRLPGFHRQAFADVIPVTVPAVPFGFVIGVAITEGDMPTWAGWMTAPFVFAGAAQLTMITLAGSATIWAVISAVLVINARHLMYSAALAPAFRHQPRWMRWFGPALLVDQVFALTVVQDRDPADFRRYYLTCGITLWLIWNAVVPLGMVVGPIVPDSWRLDYAPAVMFAGLTLLAIGRVPAAAAATVGGLVSLATVDLRDRLGIVIGGLVGVAAGMVAEIVMDRRSTQSVRDGDADDADDVDGPSPAEVRA